MASYKTLKISQNDPNSAIFHIYISSPSLRNALPSIFFSEFPKAVASLDENPSVSVIVIAGNGNHFSTGIDVNAVGFESLPDDTGRASLQLRKTIKHMQDAVSAVEQCRKPVIAAIHGACYGAGVDLVTACDLRFCSEDAFFSVKEVDLAITADLGTLQRLPSIIGYGHAMELAMTARRFSSKEAKDMGLVSRVFKTRDALDEGVRAVAEDIAGKPPLAVIGTKLVMQRSRDMTVDQSLDFVSTWNPPMLMSKDVPEAVASQLKKRKPVFAKL